MNHTVNTTVAQAAPDASTKFLIWIGVPTLILIAAVWIYILR